MFTIICDYFIFFGFLIGSTLFPLWGSLFRKKKTTDQADTKANYVFATGQVGIFAMMLSIARGTLGVRAFLGELIEIWIFFLFQVILNDIFAVTLIEHVQYVLKWWFLDNQSLMKVKLETGDSLPIIFRNGNDDSVTMSDLCHVM